MSGPQNKENIFPKLSSVNSRIAERFQRKSKCKRKLVFASKNENTSMAPIAVNRRESLSFDAILDNTDPEKLVQLIREKRGLQNAKRIFSETAEKASKRKSFPFEIQRHEPTTPTAADSEPVETADENSLSEANRKAVQSNNTHNKQNDKNVDSSENLKRTYKPRVSIKRLSQKLERRVLLKTFENLQKDCFCPEAVSTPFQRTAPIVEFASDISQINRCSSDETSTNVSEKHKIKKDKSRKSGTVYQPENISQYVPAETAGDNREQESIISNGNRHRDLVQHHKNKSNRKTETIKQSKTITESLMCQSLELHHKNAEQHNVLAGTQVYEDGNEVDETLIGANSKVNAESENVLIERTLVNEDIIDVQDTRLSNLENTNKDSKKGAQLSVNGNKETYQSTISTNHTSLNAINENIPSKQSEVQISLTNRTATTNQAASTRQSKGGVTHETNLFDAANRTTSELVSTIVNRLRWQSRERESNILAPPSPFRSTNSPRKPHGDSITIPPTQSPQGRPILMSYAKSPVVVVPYCHGSCHQNQSYNLSKPLTCPSCDKHASEKKATSVSPEKLHSILQKRASQKNNFEIIENQSNSPKAFQSDKAIYPKQSSFNNQSLLQRLDPEVTSDEDSRDRLHTKESAINGNNLQLTSNKSLSSYQFGAVDLRLSSRRSDKERLSLKQDKSRSRINRSSIHKSLNPRLSSSDRSSYSDSGEISLDKILRVDRLLKKMNNSDKTSNSILTGSKADKIEENNAKIHEYGEVNISPANEVMLEGLDENIIEVVGREDAGNGIVYDLSPRVGRIYINSLFKNGEKHKAMTSKSRRRLHMQRKSPTLSQAVTYADIETSIKQIGSNKSRKASSCSRQNRRKLYSKENSENISDDEMVPYENTTHMYETTTFTSQQPMYDRKSKISKCRIRPESAEFFTIQKLKEKWVESDPAPSYRKHKRKKETTKTISDDDEYLFKVPQQPPLKRTAIQNKVKEGKSASNIKKILGPLKNTPYNHESNEDSHSSSSDGSEISKRIPTKGNDEQQTNSTPSPCIANASKSSIDRNVESLQTGRESQIVDQEYQNVSHRNESFVSSRREFLPSSTLPAIHEVSVSINCDENICEQEQPVEPEVTSNEKTQNMRKSKTLSASKKRKNYSEHTQHDILNKSGHSTNQSEEPAPILSEIQNMSTKKSKKRSDEISPAHEKSQDKLQTPLSKKTKQSKTYRSSKKKQNKNIEDNCSSNTMSTDTQSNSGLSLRRSARKHRAPRPYWTNRYIPNEDEEICYKDYPEKKKRKYRKKLKSINEQPVELEDPEQHEEPKQVGDDLFDVVKEMSMNKKDLTAIPDVPAVNTDIESLPRKPVRKKKNTSKTTTKVVAENNNYKYTSKESPSIDSGHGTDTHVEQGKSKNFLLSWLTNLVEPKTITSNPALINIFEMNNVEIVPANQLVFRELEGVEYAYYSMATNGDNYGFIRFHPGSVKKKAKTKLFELRILNVVGELDLHIGNETGKLKNGDFVTVPKGIIYSISNSSDEIGIIFFIKTR